MVVAGCGVERVRSHTRRHTTEAARRVTDSKHRSSRTRRQTTVVVVGGVLAHHAWQSRATEKGRGVAKAVAMVGVAALAAVVRVVVAEATVVVIPACAASVPICEQFPGTHHALARAKAAAMVRPISSELHSQFARSVTVAPLVPKEVEALLPVHAATIRPDASNPRFHMRAPHLQRPSVATNHREARAEAQFSC